jgi:uncharacterized circularly permuted ATP-grasp superfamily protein/uncharacterized alpha-E superfamily protein
MAVNPLEYYAGSAQRYDELLEAGGTTRPHWQRLIEHLEFIGVEGARRGVELARRLVVENGVTYNVYADPQGKDRPWLLDPLPLPLGAAEWHEIQAGVVQRTQLLNRLLQDLYGDQRLLSDGVVPAELAYGHPNFLWPAHAVQPRHDVWLHVHAVDLARAPDGHWWVLGDRTQSPSGLGYALENRQIVGRVFPGLVNDLNVRPLTGYLEAMLQGLLTETGDGDPLAVVLTPGPFNETYFEHAYLARHLGVPLVQGQDLTVRADTVYLKTFAGLRRVHAILRRLDDDFCDALELRSESALGVAGLLGAMRAGRVKLANALGTGVLESPAWQGFLPGAAKALLGEPIRMPSVATWWCGEQPALDYVLAHLDELVIKSVFPNQSFEPVFGKHLKSAERAALKQRLQTRPNAYVAQERVLLSHAPTWQGGTRMRLAPRALTLRVFAVWTPQGYQVLPGGLARIAAENARDIVSSQRGGGSKDVWVITDQPQVVSAPFLQSLVATRKSELPSQLVENLFWLGRYSERCEDKTRLLRATLALRADRTVWPRALAVCEHLGVLAAGVDAGVSLFDENLPFGLAADLGRFGWTATQARSRLSAAHWHSVSLMQRQFHDAGKGSSEPVETLDRLLLSLTALSGFALDDMTQDDGWRVLMLGRRLERILFLSELLEQLVADGPEQAYRLLSWVLEVCSSSITYRTRHVSQPQLGPVLRLLVSDAANPRALAFQWGKIRRTLYDISDSIGTDLENLLSAPEAALAALDDSTLGVDSPHTDEIATQLHAMAAGAGQIGDHLVLRYFSHVSGNARVVTM